VGLLVNIWIPNRGEVDTKAWRVDKAVNEYDERLMFGRNEDTGDWCVFIRMPRPEQPYPVLGFGDTIPEPESALKRLRASDTMRSGNKIYDDVMRSQREYKAQFEYSSNQAAEESVEVIEHMMRKKGDSPIIKSLPKG
jgi:hypothetical protein